MVFFAPNTCQGFPPPLGDLPQDPLAVLGICLHVLVVVGREVYGAVMGMGRRGMQNAPWEHSLPPLTLAATRDASSAGGSLTFQSSNSAEVLSCRF